MDVMMNGRAGQHFFRMYPLHRHDYWEIIYNDTGSGTMQAGEASYAFSPGDVAIIPPGLLHSKESEEEFSDYSLFIRDFRPIGGESFRILKDDEHGTVRELMIMSTRYDRDLDQYARPILNALGDLLYAVLVDLYANRQLRDQRLDGMLDLMQRHIGTVGFDLSAALAESGYSKGYFRRIFHEFTGMSPVNYFQKLRVEHAKSLFAQFGGSRPIREVALACGFGDPLYFSRVFKSFEGVSPKAYLKRQMQFSSEDIRRGVNPDGHMEQVNLQSEEGRATS